MQESKATCATNETDNSGHRGFIGAGLALVVFPGDADLVAGLGALDRELQKWIFRNPRDHSAVSTDLPLRLALTSLMCQAGMVLPALSLR